MAAATGIYVLKNSIVEIDGVEYNNQTTSVRLVPEQQIQVQKTLVPDGTIQDVDAPVWTFEVTLLQKNNTGGLAKALRALAIGEQVEVELSPHNLTGEDKAVFTMVAIKPPFGGAQGAYPTAEMVFPVIGQPVFSAIA